MHASSVLRLPALLGSCALTLAACASSSEPQQSPATRSAATGSAPSPQLGPREAERLNARGVRVLSRASDGSPTLIRALRGKEPLRRARGREAQARDYVALLGEDLGLGEIATLQATGSLPLSSGATLTSFEQRVAGVLVHQGRLGVLMDAKGRFLALGGQLVDASQRSRTGFAIDEPEALRRALQAHYGERPNVRAQGRNTSPEWIHCSVAPTPSLHVSTARVRRIQVQHDKGLSPAFEVEVFAGAPSSTSSDALRLIVHGSGALWQVDDLVQDDAFRYRAHADERGVPTAGPHADFHPHPTGLADDLRPASVPGRLMTVETVKSLPQGMIDPWLPAGASHTLGNNADAYSDRYPPDGLGAGDFRASVTAPGTFDRSYDVNQPPWFSAAQQMAAVTNLFYVVNQLHDYWYDSGFDEAHGNAQTSNFGRGGEEGDAMLLEAQDGYESGSRNNANMATPADGLAPRMQMFVWNGYLRDKVLTTQLTGQVPVGMARGTASFGASTYDVSAPLSLARDGVGADFDACSPLVNLAEVAGTIALVERGGCDFESKAWRAEQAGAVGVLVMNNVNAAAPPTLGASQQPLGPTSIPVAGITLADGTQLRAQLAAQQVVNVRLAGTTTQSTDSALDNTIVQHEWGHYLHHRLARCSDHQCRAASEGWGDFIALHGQLRQGDALDGSYAMAQHVVHNSADPAYFGLRRLPYSRDMAKNPLTFGHVAHGAALPAIPMNQPAALSNAQLHNAGEIWASALFDAYLAVVERHDFEQAKRAFADHVVASLLLTPSNATYTEMRDALLTVVQAAAPDDLDAVAQAFARRGLGTCAVSPARNDDTLSGVVEGFVHTADVRVAGIELRVGSPRCDADPYLDAGEHGTVRVHLTNGGAAAEAVTVGLAAAEPALRIADASRSVAVPALGATSVDFEVELDEAAGPRLLLQLQASVEAGKTCDASPATALYLANLDEVPMSSASEGFDTAQTPLTLQGTGAEAIWSRQLLTSGEAEMRGLDAGYPSDTSWVSPPLQVRADAPLVVELEHAYQFEQADGSCFDGAVVELSTDGGVSWSDVSTRVVTAPYTGTVAADPAGELFNVLAERPAFCGTSPGYPALHTSVLDFGMGLAGQTVQLRLRIGTDAAVGDEGWRIDTVRFAGIVGTPFGRLGAQASVCQTPPLVRAGEDRTAQSGDTVVLLGEVDATLGAPTESLRWSQLAGPAVSLSATGSLATSFVAPEVTQESVVVLQLQAQNAHGVGEDDVQITVRPRGGEFGDAGAFEDDAGVGGEDDDRGDAGGGGAADGGAAGPGTAPPGEEGSATAPPADEGGCGCDAVGSAPRQVAAGWPTALLGLAGLLGARLRRRTAG